MARNRVYEADLLVPAGTPQTAPATFVIPLPQGLVGRVTLTVPPGHAGNTGFQLLWAGVPIVPYGGAGWIVADDYTDSWELDQDVNPGQLVMAGYNADVFAHTFFLRILWSQGPVPLPISVSLAAPAGTGPDLSGLGAAAPGASGGPGAAGTSSVTGAGICYDVNGAQVPCSSPGAVTGPVSAPGGTSGSPGPASPVQGTTGPYPGSPPGGTSGSGSPPGGTSGSPPGSSSPPGGSSPPGSGSPAPGPGPGPGGGGGGLPAWPAPVNLHSTTYPDYADLAWGSGAGNHDYHVQVYRGQVTYADSVALSDGHFRVTGLKPGTVYSWRVAVDADSSHQSSAWAVSAFTTRP